MKGTGIEMKRFASTAKAAAKWQQVLALAMAGIFALSAAMTGTAAWADLSQHRTNAAEGVGPSGPVGALLQKYETNTEIPVPGAQFGLYRMNPVGTANLIDTFLTGPDGQALASDLEPGNYYWQETQPAPGFLPELEDGQPKKYPFSVPSEDGGPVFIVAYNTRQLGSLTVTKTVTGEGADLTREFSFTAVIGARTEMFTLRHGLSIVFEEIPVGTAYEIIETPVAGYVISSENSVGNVPSVGVTASFTNTYTIGHGSLVVTKAVTGEGADHDKNFSFTAVIGGETQSFELKHGQSKIFENLPVGTAYTITETDYTDDSYTTAQRTRNGTILASGELVHLVYVNEYGPPEPEKGNLVITKIVEGGGERDKAFSFIATIGSGTESFGLKHGESKIFTGIPAGTQYTVAEDDYTNDGYTTRFIPSGSNTGVIAGGQTASAACVNHMPPELRLTVIKQVVGNPPERDSGKLFHFTLTINGTQHEFDLKSGEATDPFVVYPGDVYSLTEQDYIGDRYLRGGVSNGSGVVGADHIEIVQINTYMGPETIDIEGEKTWQFSGSPAVIQLPDSVTIQLKNGDVTVKTATATVATDWRYTFTNLPRHDALGDVIPYTVEEIRIPGWRSVVTGYDIENIHQPPVTDDPIEVEKAVAGTPPEDLEFRFVLTPVNGAPMPENNEITVTGAGQAAFGAITYSVPGIYIYTITEIDGGLSNWSYDASVYTLTVEVAEDEDGQLAVNRAFTKTGQPAEKAVFTNSYSDVVEYINVRVTKAWQGGDEKRPQSVQVQLYKDGTAYGSPTTLSAANSWTRIWNDLTKGHAWTVDELNVSEGYTKVVSGDAVNGFTITNTKGILPETTDVLVTKVWKGEDENRPASVVMQLYKDGAAAGIPVTLSGANGWAYTWNALEKGHAWTVDEVNVPAGYSKTVTGDMANGFVITNTKLPSPPPGDEITINGKKTWNHGDNPMDKRPASITVIIKADGAIVTQRMITAAEHWGWSFNLPKYNKDGKEITYTVDEARFEDYVKTMDGYNLINTYKPGGNTDDPDPGKPISLPKTDDNGNLALWLTLMALSLGGLAATAIAWSKMKGKRKQS